MRIASAVLELAMYIYVATSSYTIATSELRTSLYAGCENSQLGPYMCLECN